MAVYLNAASSQYLRNGSPFVTGFSFSVGMWFRLTAVANVVRTLVALSDTGTVDNVLRVRMTLNEFLQQGAMETGQADNANSGTVLIVPGDWCYMVARFISATERRTVHMTQVGGVTHHHLPLGSVSRAPTGMDCLTIGGMEISSGHSLYWDGSVAEFWIANIDIGKSGNPLPNDLVSQLAFNGPFSVPHVQASLVEYRSFRQGITSNQDRKGHVYHGRVPQTWTAVNGPLQLSAHPPLPNWYQRPGQAMRPLMI